MGNLSGCSHRGFHGHSRAIRRPRALAIGTTVGTYRVSAKLGEGGMGEVWRATDEKLGREVALKALPAAVADDGRGSLDSSARPRSSRPSPPRAIATLFGLETLERTAGPRHGARRGRALSARIARGPPPLAEALPIALQIAQALEATHEKGIVRRDLKPANLTLRPDGAGKVLDFGLAKAWDEERSQGNLSCSPTITQHHTKVGVIRRWGSSSEQPRTWPPSRRRASRPTAAPTSGRSASFSGRC